MSVVGIDFGNKNGVMAVARRGGIDVLSNEASNRQTPAMVSFSNSGSFSMQRLIGESASVNFIRNSRGTVAEFKRFLGSDYKECCEKAEYAGDLRNVTCPTKELEVASGLDGEKQTTLGFCVGEEGSCYSPEQISGMFLAHLRGIGERETQAPVRDVVLSVPGYYSERQRRALLDAAEIAGFNVLRLLNEHTAVALAYGFYREDLPPDGEPGRKVLFVDMGHSATTASVVTFTKSRLAVNSVAFDRFLGGRDFDMKIAESLADECSTKLGGDPRKNTRQWLRLLAGCERQVKRVISAGTPRANISIDNLCNDRDYNTVVSKETFAELVAPLLERVVEPVKRALASAKVAPSELGAVEIVGGGMRLPHVQEKLAQFLGRELSKTLNMEEAVARGCALMCAMLSPVFRVRDYKVEDITPYPIRLSWNTPAPSPKGAAADTSGKKEGESDGSDSAIIIGENNVLPAPKMISFARKDPIVLAAHYDQPSAVPFSGQDGLIGRYWIDAIPPASKPTETPKLKVKARLNSNGTFAIEEAETHEIVEEVVEIEETVPAAAPAPAPPKKPAGDAKTEPPAATAPAATAPAAPASTSPQTQETKEEKGEEKKEEESKDTEMKDAKPESKETGDSKDKGNDKESKDSQPETKRKRKEVRKRTVKKEVKVRVERLGQPRGALQQWVETEGKLQAADRLAVETAEAKNRLESYQYTMRDKLEYSDLRSYGEAAVVAAFETELAAVREWLYEEGESQTKGVYVERLARLEAVGTGLLRRKAEAEARPQAVQALTARIDELLALVRSKDPKYDHIPPEEREKAETACNETAIWLGRLEGEQNKLLPSAEPALTVAMLTAKRTELESRVLPIMNKPPPPPPPPPKADPEPPANPANGNADTTMQDTAGNAAAAAASAAQQQQSQQQQQSSAATDEDKACPPPIPMDIDKDAPASTHSPMDVEKK